VAVFPVILDANVLFGIFPTDLLITLAGRRLYRAHWTAEILEEARRNVIAERPDLDPSAVKRRFEAMKAAMPEAMLDPPPRNIVASMPNDEGDRHVLAAAVMARAEVIVTENISDFSPQACSPFGVEAQTLDQFLGYLVSLDADEVWRAIEEMSRRRTRPPVAVDDVVATLERYAPAAIAQLHEP
jgi:predicted nucleic acid-binding protein